MKASGDSGQLLELAFQSLPDAVFIIDAEMVEIIDCNPAAEKMFGYSREEMLGRPLVLFHVDEAALETFKAHLHPAVKEEGFLHLPEFKMRRKLVTFMNPVAESLTGWDEAAAKGHSLDDVFKTSKEQAEELAEEAMVKTAQGDVTAGSASYTVLWAKDGTKRPIVDSWAPIEDAMGVE